MLKHVWFLGWMATCLKIVHIMKAKKHSLDLNAFATLIQKVSKAYGEIHGIDIVLLMLKGSSMPLLEPKGEGNLSSVQVGDGPTTWNKGSEAAKVVARFFKPYGKASS
jgi:hypothetical protein